MKENSHPNIKLSQKALRKTARFALEPWFLPSEAIHLSDGMQRAEELHKDGYGILALITHFSRRDPEQAMDVFMRSREFQHTPITGPIAHHQTVRGLVPPVGRKLGVEMHPVVTKQTLEKALTAGKPENLTLGQGTFGYIKAATRALQNGEVVIMAPQGTREPHLEHTGQDSVNGLLRIAERKTPKIGIHLLSFGIPGTADYGQRRGFNFFKSYDVYHGPTFTLQEALGASADYSARKGLEGSGMDNIDSFVFDEFRKIVPASYLPPTNGQSHS